MKRATLREGDVLFPEVEAVPPKRLTRQPKLQGAGHADNFQTPGSALEPLLPYLPKEWVIWEPSCGKGNLARRFVQEGYEVRATDLLTGIDFLLQEVPYCRSDAIVTNPPFSLKNEFLAHCYELGKPFALLLPLTALEGKARQELYRAHGLELILMEKRVNFETPNGAGSSAWFATAWYTWGLNIGRELTFSKI